ncbi:hypothetical protein [Ramlibacter pallidus]|uniref:Uncharacterized protein n=1 Tax=Ramlibacter pallidus TaxID=2780087 RepID=A0ABR9RYD6_9BURK|nr:hypothetical protein [Ramlibacter pallidus]MBE7366252.1 hypothetical protein [Ramlibacter pallidus]
MKRIVLAAAAIAAIAAPAAFAQSAAGTFTTPGYVIFEGPPQSKPIRGAVVGEAVLAGSHIAVAPSQATVAAAPSTAVLGGPAASVSAGPSVVKHYWNVPSDIGTRVDFQRWQRLM